MVETGRYESFAHIRILGVGGAGSNAINRMIAAGIGGVEFAAINTDSQALLGSRAPVRVHIGERSTRGLGAGGDPRVGEKAAHESLDELRALVADTDMVFVTAGMGGGTGTGAAPVIAKLAREQKALTIGVVTRPFTFEGSRRNQQALEGIQRLQEHVDTLIVIPNDRLLELANHRVALTEAFCMADEVLQQGIQGISELITIPGLINLDFADVRAVMGEGGAALMAVGAGKGRERALHAAESAISSRLLDITIDGAKGILLNITGGRDMTLYEVNQAAHAVRERAHRDANVFFGAVIDETMQDEMRITLIATSFERPAISQLSAMASRAGTSYSRPAATREPEPAHAVPTAHVEAAPVQAAPARATASTPERHIAPPRDRQPEPEDDRRDDDRRDDNRRDDRRDDRRELPRFSPGNLEIPAFLRRDRK